MLAFVEYTPTHGNFLLMTFPGVPHAAVASDLLLGNSKSQLRLIVSIRIQYFNYKCISRDVVQFVYVYALPTFQYEICSLYFIPRINIPAERLRYFVVFVNSELSTTTALYERTRNTDRRRRDQFLHADQQEEVGVWYRLRYKATAIYHTLYASHAASIPHATRQEKITADVIHSNHELGT